MTKADMCSRSRLAALDSRPARPHRLQRATARQYRYSIFQEHGTQIACNSPKLPRRPSIPSNANPLHHVPEPPRILRLYCASSEFGGFGRGSPLEFETTILDAMKAHLTTAREILGTIVQF